MRFFKRIIDKVEREHQNYYCKRQYRNTNNLLNSKHKKFGTIFFDYEGEWAKVEQKSNSVIGVNHVLKTLQELNLKATFNTVGKLFEREDIIDEIIRGKHEIASHTYKHTVVKSFSRGDIVIDFNRYRKFIKRKNIVINGFRAPQSKWNFNVLDGLIESKIKWDAEDDSAAFPYIIKEVNGQRLWRIPVKVDDWIAEGKNFSPLEMYNYWIEKYQFAIDNGFYFSIGFHPWLLAKDPERLFYFDKFLQKLVEENKLEILTFGEVASYYDSLIKQ